MDKHCKALCYSCIKCQYTDFPKFSYDSNNNIFNLVNFSNDLVFPSKAGDNVSPCKLFTIAVHNST